MRTLPVLCLGALVLLPHAASAKTPTQRSFHEAFERMDGRWPNLGSHEYWLALRDAEDLAVKLSDEERVSDGDVTKDLRIFPVYRACWLALVAKERALREDLIGQLIVRDQPGNAEAAREHFALAVASWDEAFHIWPYMRGEKVRGDSLDGQGDLVFPGAMWREAVARRLEDVTPR
jgi:hypothetical protein